MSTGPVWAVEIDVVDCYPSFDGKKLKDLLPIPKEVSEHVLISEHLNLKGGNLAGITKSGPFGPAGNPEGSTTPEGTLAAARRGIPQGSAASPFIAETILAIALREVPKLGDIVAYGDNCLLLAKKESDMVTMMQTLETALKAHPVGLLTPKRKLFHPGQPVEFLGHRLTLQSSGKIRVESSQKNWEKFERKIKRQLNRLKYEKLSAAKRLREQKRQNAMSDLGWLRFAFAMGSASTRNTGSRELLTRLHRRPDPTLAWNVRTRLPTSTDFEEKIER